MKRLTLILAALLTLGMTAGNAQGFGNPADKVDTTGWFAGTGIGFNIGFDGQKYVDRANSHCGAGFGNDIYVGYWFNEWGGVRAGFQGLSLSDKFTDFGYKRYEYLHADMLLRPHRNIIPYLHIGWARIDNSAFGGGVGIAFPIYLTKHIAIVPDFKATTYTNQVYATPHYFPAVTLSGMLGISISLGHFQKPGSRVPKGYVQVPEEDYLNSRPSIVRDTVLVTQVQHDTVTVTNEVVHEVIKEVIKEKIITTISAEALFDYNMDIIRDEAKPELMAVVDWMNEHPNVGIIVEGHTDNHGSRDYNMNLSLRRAQSVKQFLVRNGIRPSLITVEGYGFDRPIAPNTTPEGRQLNRRVEVRVRIPE